MRPPVCFAWGNVVFGADLDDAWALLRVEPDPYESRTSAQKRELLSDLAAFAYGIEADFSLQRVCRALSPDGARARAVGVADPMHARPQLDAYLDRQRDALAHRALYAPELYLSVRLASGARSLEGLTGALRAWRARIGLRHPGALPERRLRELAAAEERVLARASDFLPCRRATPLELQWLIRRALCRGAGEPDLDSSWEPQALALLDGDALAYQPLQVDVVRLFRGAIDIRDRFLTVSSEAGRSCQAALCLGALPDAVAFPGPAAELLHAPLEAVEFPVDAVFSAAWVSNGAAARLVRRRVVDADNEAAEFARSDHGLSPDAARRPAAARELEDYLASSSHPPLLRATISLCVGAPDPGELEARVERLRREYAPVRLERPCGDQLRLWSQHFPAQPSRLRDYEDLLLVEQLGAMVPTATTLAGADAGFYLGHTLTGAARPVLWEPAEACRRGLTPAVLLCGPPGRGKTATLQRLLYEAFLAGSQVVDVDPKPDHRWAALSDVAEYAEVIEFRPDPAQRGALDPLRIAPPEEGEDLAVDWLLALLRRDVPHTWETEIRRAVKQVLARADGRHGPGCGDVIAALEAGNPDAQAAGRALDVLADSGLAQLGFAARDTRPPGGGSKPVTLLRVAGLRLPDQGVASEALGAQERIGQALLALVASYALALMADDPARHTMLSFDEAWVLTGTPAGRRLLRRANRLGRAQNGTPLLGTQTLSDVDDELRELLGAVMCFGAETDAEARRALELLGQDAGDDGLRARLLRFRAGRCLLRDYSRRLAAIQVDFGWAPELLAALDTTPGRR